MVEKIDTVPEMSEVLAEDNSSVGTNAKVNKNSALATVYEGVSVFFKWVPKLSVVGVALLAYFEYSDANTDKKRVQSLSYANSWVDRGVSSSFKRVGDFTSKKLESSQKLPNTADIDALSLAKTNLGRVWSKEAISSDAPIVDDIENVFQFFSQLEICIASTLCDEQIALAYFESEIETFWPFFSGFALEKQNLSYTGYGSKVEALYSRAITKDN